MARSYRVLPAPRHPHHTREVPDHLLHGRGGNTALGYPEGGAVHGILTVERITTSDPPYLVQTWLDTWNMWIARRRLYNGAWSEWSRDDSGGSSADPRVDTLTGFLEPPPSLGSSEDLDTVTEPGRKKASSSSVTGNPPDLHYPTGAQHGFLDVVRMATSYTSQIWTEVYGGLEGDAPLLRRRVVGVGAPRQLHTIPPLARVGWVCAGGPHSARDV